jgi:hypothetical protein
MKTLVETKLGEVEARAEPGYRGSTGTGVDMAQLPKS